MASYISLGMSDEQEQHTLSPDARAREPNSGDQDAFMSHPQEGHPSASESWLINPLPLSTASSPLLDLNISLEELLRHGPAAEGLSVEAPLLRALKTDLPSSDGSFVPLVESIDGSESFIDDERQSTMPDGIEGNERIGSMSQAPSGLADSTVRPQPVYFQRRNPSLPGSDLGSSQYTLGSSLEDLLGSDSIRAPPPGEGEEPANIPLPPSPAPQANSLEDLSRIGYGRMTYIENVRRTAQHLSHLNIILSPSRNDECGFLTWYDYVGSSVYQGPSIGNLHHGHTKEEVYRLRTQMKNAIPPNVHTRLIVAADLSIELIDFLGSAFDVSPECFAEHLNNSGYDDGLSRDKDPLSWMTAGMKKDYVSVSWLRPVLRHPGTPSPTQLRQLLDPEYDGLQWLEKKIVEQRAKLYPVELQHFQKASSNILRPEFPLGTSNESAQNGPSSWREKTTVWFDTIRGCKIVLVLTDPVPCALERVEGPMRDTYFGFSIDGTSSPITQARRGNPHPRRIEERSSPPSLSNTYTKVFPLFNHLSPRLSAWLDYKRILMNYDDLRAISTTTTGTYRDISRGLWQVPQPQNPNFGESILSYGGPIIFVLFNIIASDTDKILQVMRTKLREIDHGTMDDMMLQQNLQIWRASISRMRHILPEIHDSVHAFVSFADDPRRLFLPAQERAPTEISRLLRQLDLDISSTLKLAVDTQMALSTNISIIDSKRGISEAEAVGRLTELAFLFIPMTFAASLFSMQVPQIHGSLKQFIGVSFALLIFVYSLRISIRSRPVIQLGESISHETRAYNKFTGSQGLPTMKFLTWAWARCARPAAALLLILGSLSTAIAFIWVSTSGIAYKVVFTVYVIVAFVIVVRYLVVFEEMKNLFHLWSTERFLQERDEKLGQPTILQRARTTLARNRLWRVVRGQGIITLGSLLVFMAPVVPLWSQSLDLRFKIGITMTLFLMAFVVRIGFTGHETRHSRDDVED